MIERIIKVGNKLVVPLSEEVTKALQLTEGSEVNVNVDSENNWILISPVGYTADIEEIDSEFASQVSAFIKDYKPALEELAKSKK